MRPHKMGTGDGYWSVSRGYGEGEHLVPRLKETRRCPDDRTQDTPEEGGQMRATLREVLLYHGNISLPLWC